MNCCKNLYIFLFDLKNFFVIVIYFTILDHFVSCFSSELIKVLFVTLKNISRNCHLSIKVIENE